MTIVLFSLCKVSYGLLIIICHVQSMLSISQCHPGIGAIRMINNLDEEPPKVMIMGAALSTVSESTALLSHFYNLTQVF